MPGAMYSGVSWADTFGNLWLFGGQGYNYYGYDATLDDLWKYNIATGLWTWINGSYNGDTVAVYGSKGVSAAANGPGSRRGGVSWIDASNNLWLFGGTAIRPAGVSGGLNDLWKFTTSTGQWTWISGDSTFNNYGIYGIKGVSAITNKPGARSSCGNWIDGFGNLWMFGGAGFAASGGSNYLNDLWEYNIGTSKWTWISGDSTTNFINSHGVYGIKGIADPNNKPGARFGCVSWNTSGNLWLFGGYSVGTLTQWTSSPMNDLWKYQEENFCAGGNISFMSNLTGASYQWQLSTDHGLTFNIISDNSNYSGTTTRTLTIANTPSTWYGYQYRCVVNGSNSRVFTLIFSNYWTGAISNAWENPGNWSCGVVPDSYTDVYLPSGATVVINSNVTIATLNINPTASLTVTPPHTLTLFGH
jgi:hypothetical protein